MFGKIASAAKNTVSNIADAADDAIDGAADVAKSAVKGAEEAVKSGVDAASSGARKAGEFAEDVWETGASANERANEYIRETADDVYRLGAKAERELKEAGGALAKDVADDVKSTSRKAKRSIRQAETTIRDLQQDAVEKSKRTLQSASKTLDTIEKTTRTTAAKTGALYVSPKTIVAHKELLSNTIDELRSQSVEEFMENGWESVGFGKEERERLKEAALPKLEQASRAVETAVNTLIEQGKEVTLEGVKVMSEHALSPVTNVMVQSVLHEGGMAGVINDKVDVLEGGALAMSHVIADNAALFEPASLLMEHVAGGLDAVDDTPIPFLLSKASPQLFGMMSEQLAFHSALLEAGASIPGLAESIQQNPEDFRASMALIRPDHMAHQIAHLEDGQSIKFLMGGEVEARALNLKSEAELQIERSGDKVKITLKNMQGIGESIGSENEVGEVGYGFGMGGELVFEVPVDQADKVVTQLMQLNIHNLGDQDFSAFSKIEPRGFMLPIEGELKGKLKAKYDGGSAALEGGLKVSAAHGFEREGDKKLQVFKMGVEYGLGVSVGTDPVKIALPDSMGSNRAAKNFGSLIGMLPANEQASLASSLIHQDSSRAAKVAAGMEMEVKLDYAGNLQGSMTGKLKMELTPNIVDARVKLELKDGKRLAETLGQSGKALAAQIQAGELNLIEIAEQYPDLVPDVLDVRMTSDLISYDDVGFEASGDLGSVKLKQRHQVKESLVSASFGVDGKRVLSGMDREQVVARANQELEKMADNMAARPKRSSDASKVLDFLGGFGFKV